MVERNFVILGSSLGWSKSVQRASRFLTHLVDQLILFAESHFQTPFKNLFGIHGTHSNYACHQNISL